VSASIILTGPHIFEARQGRPGTAALYITSEGAIARFELGTRAECDALVRAALAARDLLPPVGGECTCGAHVSADGTVTPAGAS
jgi:hypothetical protein